MKDLYSTDVVAEISKRTEKIRDKIEKKLKIEQNEINTYENYKAYQYHRSQQQEYANHIRYLYVTFIKYLDRTAEEFQKAFAGNYKERIFELVMADFLGKKFILQERPIEEKNSKSIADLAFKCNEKLYFLECTTRNASELDRYLKEWPKIEAFFEMVIILHSRTNQLKKEGVIRREDNWKSGGIIDEVLSRMNETEKGQLKSLMSISGIKIFDTLAVDLQEWINFNLRIFGQFEDVLPQVLSNKIKKYIKPLPLSERGSNKKYYEFIIKQIARKIIEKLEQSYCNDKTPVIISVSVATLPYSIETVETMNAYYKDIGERLIDELSRKVKEKKFTPEKIERISKGIKYLYAIIIDTSSYNWFPDIVIKKCGANFPIGYNNCYYLIYNTNLAIDIACESGIFDSLIERHFDLHINIDGEKSAIINKKLEIQNIKDHFLKVKDKYELLRSEVINCARQIKIWLTIAQAKEEFKSLQQDSFWAWTQAYSCLRLITIDSFKVLSFSKKYINSVINFLPKDQYKELLKNSRLQKRLSKLKDIIEPLKLHHNKKFIRLENVEFQNISCNLQDLFFAIMDVDNSLSYISYYLLNPELIIDGKWNAFTLQDAEVNAENNPLDYRFKNDYVVQDCIKVLEELNQNTLNEYELS